jgi:hypothetical protein
LAFFGVRPSWIAIVWETPESTFSDSFGVDAALGFFLFVDVLCCVIVRSFRAPCARDLNHEGRFVGAS